MITTSSYSRLVEIFIDTGHSEEVVPESRSAATDVGHYYRSDVIEDIEW